MKKTITYAEWIKEGVKLFGRDSMQWRFRCPSCGIISAVSAFRDLGQIKAAGYSCIGRFLPSPKDIFENPGPCKYAGGGIFRLNPVTILMPDKTKIRVFAFAKEEGSDE